MNDDDVVYAMRFCKALRIGVYIRGTDSHPVVEIRDKYSRRIIGGIELKRRIKNHGREHSGWNPAPELPAWPLNHD